jgi:hypothetical protein
MCDYSLHAVSSRPAKVGDRLVTQRFSGTDTRGLAAVEQPDVAVCLLPGTEVAFQNEVDLGPLARLFRRTIPDKVARFCQINMDNPATHHDALEFANGSVLLVTQLRRGQTLTVLQMPVVAPDKSQAPEYNDAAADCDVM